MPEYAFEPVQKTPPTRPPLRPPPDAGPATESSTGPTPEARPGPSPSPGPATTAPLTANLTWEETGNLIGEPPVRSRTHPPNINVIEDEGVYHQRRAAAAAVLARQQQRAAAMVDKDDDVTDYRYWFAKVYSRVTTHELEYARQRAFYYPSYVLASVQYFDKIYGDNFQAHSDGRAPEAHWLRAFKTAERTKDVSAVLDVGLLVAAVPLMVLPALAIGGLVFREAQQLLTATTALVESMKAHIRFDLPRAEAWVYNSLYSDQPGVTIDAFEPDFMSMSGVFEEAARDMTKEMDERLSWLADEVPQLVQDMVMRNAFDADMATERADTWRRARELVNHGLAGEDPYMQGDGRPEGDVTRGDHLAGLARLPTTSLRPSMDGSAEMQSDDEIVALVREMPLAQLAALPTIDKIRFIRGLLRGATFDDDENAILRLLAAARVAGDLVTVVDGADAWDIGYGIDHTEFAELRARLRVEYYGKTGKETALRLIRKCLDGDTGEWEEQMVVDILEAHPEAREIVSSLGRVYGGPAEGADAEFKNGLNKLEWQLDGEEEERLEGRFGKSGASWWRF